MNPAKALEGAAFAAPAFALMLALLIGPLLTAPAHRPWKQRILPSQAFRSLA